ncbi:head maturation protease, ClpP-related [Wukongibacter sp. M2B1]|uniref:head maturation protease, ClpP-related n=1 Tax=Wukongibacter sp. M2B1 TaxID=3088895 RepID=UPI003D7945EC
MKEKFYTIKNNISNKAIDIFVYGEIISGSEKWDESDVTFLDFKNKLDSLVGDETINLYINSIGGSVFTTQGIIAMLQRAKEKGVTINSYIDGIGASCASFLPLVADDVYIYKSSMMMVHKPFGICIGNSKDLLERAEMLDKIENSVMMPLYMSKVKEGITEEYVQSLINKETWLDSKEISDLFDVVVLENDKELVACVKDKSILDNYKNVPQSLLSKLENIIDDTKAEEAQAKQNKIELLKAKMELELEL